jgi:hypothetical protein
MHKMTGSKYGHWPRQAQRQLSPMNEEDVMSNNNIRSMIEDLAALGVLDAHELADLAIELTITALVQDPAIPPRPFSEWWPGSPTRARFLSSTFIAASRVTSTLRMFCARSSLRERCDG